MEKHLNHIDNLFKEGLGGYSETPPSSVWDALEERLDNDDKKRPGFFYRRRWIILILACLSVFSSLMAWRMTGGSDETLAANRQVPENTISTVQEEKSNTAGGTNEKSPLEGSTTAVSGETKHNNANTTTAVAKHDDNDNKAQETNATANSNAQNTTGPSASTNQDQTNSKTETSQTAANENKASKTGNTKAEGEFAMATDSKDNNTSLESKLSAPKTEVIKYIVKTRTRNNIEVAEAEPVFGPAVTHTQELLSEPGEEEETTYGNKPSTTTDRHSTATHTFSGKSSATALAVNKLNKVTSRNKPHATSALAMQKMGNKATNNATAVVRNHSKHPTGRATLLATNTIGNKLSTTAANKTSTSPAGQTKNTVAIRDHEKSVTPAVVATQTNATIPSKEKATTADQKATVLAPASKSQTKTTVSTTGSNNAGAIASVKSAGSQKETAVSSVANKDSHSKNKPATTSKQLADATQTTTNGTTKIAISAGASPVVKSNHKPRIAPVAGVADTKKADVVSTFATSKPSRKHNSGLLALNAGKHIKSTTPAHDANNTSNTPVAASSTVKQHASHSTAALKNEAKPVTETSNATQKTAIKKTVKNNGTAVAAATKAVTPILVNNTKTSVAKTTNAVKPADKNNATGIAKHTAVASKPVMHKNTSAATAPNDEAGNDESGSVATANKPAKQAVRKTTGHIKPVVKAVPQQLAAAQTATTKTPATSANSKGTKPAQTAIVVPAAATPVVKAATVAPKPAATPVAAVAAKIPGTFKADTTPFSMKPKVDSAATAAAVANTKTDSPAAHKKGFLGFEMGVKGGFENGFGSGAARKGVISPFLERQLTPKLSLLIQPAFKFASISSRELSGSQSFYNITDSSVTNNGNYRITVTITNGGTVDTFIVYRSNFTYSQTHDSVSKTYSIGGTYTEFELPLLLKYALTKRLSVYGGVNVNYSKTIRVNETTTTTNSIINTKFDPAYSYVNGGATPVAIASEFHYSGTPLSNYKGPLYPGSSNGLFRLGYMLGLSYEINKRYMFDALMQQSAVKTNIQGGYDINKAISTTYFRLTLGYRLFRK